VCHANQARVPRLAPRASTLKVASRRADPAGFFARLKPAVVRAAP